MYTVSTDQRRQFRFAIARRGFVTQGKKTTVCEVHDLTEQGLQFHVDLPLSPDESIRVEIQLDGDCIIHCELLIVHANRPRFGGRIIRISPEDRQQLAEYIQRLVLFDAGD